MTDIELKALVAKAQVRFDALTPQQQAAYREAQRKSYVIGEMMLEHPEMTRGYVEQLYQRVAHA